MAWWAKGLAAKPDNLSLIPGIYMMDREHQLTPSCLLSCAVMYTGFWCVCVMLCFALFETRSHVFQAGLKLILCPWTTLNSFPQEAGDHRCALPHPVRAMHRMKPRALSMLVKHATVLQSSFFKMPNCTGRTSSIYFIIGKIYTGSPSFHAVRVGKASG